MAKKKSGINRLKIILTLFVVLCLGTAIGLLFTPIFEVREVYCEGNSRVAQETLLEAAQVGVGKNIIFQNLSKIEKSISDIPEIEEVTVKRVFPNKIKVWVKERIPAGYIYTDNKCVAVDLEGRALSILEGDEALKVVEALTPEKLEGREEAEENSGENKDGNSEENSEENATETEENAEEQAPETEEAQEEEPQAEEVTLPYEIPLVVGLELKSPDAGKEIQSKEQDKLNKVMETFNSLEKAGLLRRATYLDVTNMNDVILVIEKRLEIQLGSLENIEYRCAFLSKVINEKMSSTEYAVMDYRNDDVYVRQPDDGKERMVPKPSPTPEPTEAPEEESEEDENSEEPEPTATATRSAADLEG